MIKQFFEEVKMNKKVIREEHVMLFLCLIKARKYFSELEEDSILSVDED